MKITGDQANRVADLEAQVAAIALKRRPPSTEDRTLLEELLLLDYPTQYADLCEVLRQGSDPWDEVISLLCGATGDWKDQAMLDFGVRRHPHPPTAFDFAIFLLAASGSYAPLGVLYAVTAPVPHPPPISPIPPPFEVEAPSARARNKRLAEEWLGYDRDRPSRLLVVNPTEALLVQRIFAEASRSGNIVEALATRLNREGVTQKDGDSWHEDAVLRILTNRLYLGDAQYRGFEFGEHEALIEKAVWDRVHMFLTRYGSGKPKQQTGRSFGGERGWTPWHPDGAAH